MSPCAPGKFRPLPTGLALCELRLQLQNLLARVLQQPVRPLQHADHRWRAPDHGRSPGNPYARRGRSRWFGCSRHRQADVGPVHERRGRPLPPRARARRHHAGLGRGVHLTCVCARGDAQPRRSALLPGQLPPSRLCRRRRRRSSSSYGAAGPRRGPPRRVRPYARSPRNLRRLTLLRRGGRGRGPNGPQAVKPGGLSKRVPPGQAYSLSIGSIQILVRVGCC
eukprot:SAG31_NODE_2759_length_5134_cov_5.037736_7_plen_223_part_00